MTTLKRNITFPLLLFYGLGTILGAGIYVLTGEDGDLLAFYRRPDGIKKKSTGKKTTRRNRILDEFRRATKPLKLPKGKSYKNLRSSGATILETHKVHRHSSTLWLSHSAASMKDKHYTPPPQEQFNDAVEWLGEQMPFDVT